MMGMLVVHPRQRQQNPTDRDYVILLSEWRIDPGASRPVTTEMTEFNVLTMNSKAYPATRPNRRAKPANAYASVSATSARWTITRSTCTAIR